MSLPAGYTAQVLSDALVYAEHAGKTGPLDEEDVKLAVQSRVGWEFGGRVPKEVCFLEYAPESIGLSIDVRTPVQFLLSLSNKINSKPLPPVNEVFGVRLPPAKNCLAAVDFDLVPNKPPPGLVVSQGEDEEEEDDSADDGEDEEGLRGDRDRDDDMEMADGSVTNLFSMPMAAQMTGDREDYDDPADEGPGDPTGVGSGGPDEDDLFGEDEGDEDAAMEEAEGSDPFGGHSEMPNGFTTAAGGKRKADDDDDDYDA